MSRRPPLPRRTLAAPATLEGPALFTGADARLTVRPSTAGGLLLRSQGHTAPATIEHLAHAPIHPAFATLKPRCTSLRVGPQAVGTLEHALSALAALGVTDAVLDVEGPELPILDGSAAPLVRAIDAAGLTDLPGHLEPITLDRPFEIFDGDARLTAEPADTIDYAYRLDYGPDAPIPPATARWTGDPDDYRSAVAPARTFSTLAEATQMQSLGLFARFTPRDLLVIGPDGPVDNAWRFPDECARHKLLDLIGDLALLGRPLLARVRAHKTGHAHTHDLVRAILAR
jgi:UDP-3-O-acyl-N-acetylglucosamine deacetylase